MSSSSLSYLIQGKVDVPYAEANASDGCKPLAYAIEVEVYRVDRIQP